jgi:hypothetical protein
LAPTTERGAEKSSPSASVEAACCISISNARKSEFEGNEMMKLIAAAAAFVLFAPFAAAILLQAARIVA